MNKSSLSSVIHASLLVTGTCIGGGMLALPLWIAQYGFAGASVGLIICWLFMTLTALMLLKSNSWLKLGTHFVNTAEQILGPYAKSIAWFVYAFIAYASLVAYVAGGAQILLELFWGVGFGEMAEDFTEIFFTIACGVILAFGAKILAKLNSFFFALMMAMFVAILVLGMPLAQFHDVSGFKIEGLRHSFPLFLTSFSFQMIVPSIRNYLGGDDQKCRQSIWIGMSLTLAIYLVWMLFVYWVMPLEGPYSLMESLKKGEPVTSALIQVVHSKWLLFWIAFFSLFAIITSFLGISLGLYEFLEDSLNLKKKKAKIWLLALVLIPPLIGAVSFEGVFLSALDLTGGLGDTVINGLLPISMVAAGHLGLGRVGQLRLHPSKTYVSPLGWATLLLCALLAVAVLGMELQRVIGGLL
jgi:tyrosine-specific transport protein